MSDDAVKRTPELERILNLPRRAPSGPAVDALARDLTPLLQKPGATMQLRPGQGLAVHDIGLMGGAFITKDVGLGKTLDSFLAAYVLDAKRPLMLQPAGLIRKTVRDRDEVYGPHWLIPNHIKILSYEMLGRFMHADELEIYKPDLIIADEVPRLKNLEASVTKRVGRWMAKHPTTRFVALSGTMMEHSILDFWHILRWCLRDNAPVPRDLEEAQEWALAMDERVAEVDELRRLEPGALLLFADAFGIDPSLPPRTRARLGFQQRMLQTPGVVSAVGGEDCKASIYVSAFTYKVKPITEAHFAKLRGEALTPDGWDVTPVDVWRHARELALGFHQIWDPRPPEEWLAARKAWFRFVRRSLGPDIDSPEHVAALVDRGELPGGEGVLAKWRYQRDESGFVPNPVPVWHDDSALKAAAEWMSSGGIVWTEHVAFAVRLSEMTGAPYYGPKGRTESGAYIQDATAPAIIASIDANREGLNMQVDCGPDGAGYSRNLFVSPEGIAAKWQQAIGRTHRTRQTADVVTVDVFLGCAEHAQEWAKAMAAARSVHETTGASQKLLLADVDWPTDAEIAAFRGARWRAPKIQPFHIPV